MTYEHDIIDRLEREIERLRGALTRVMNTHVTCGGVMVKIAEDALDKEIAG